MLDKQLCLLRVPHRACDVECCDLGARRVYADVPRNRQEKVCQARRDNIAMQSLTVISLQRAHSIDKLGPLCPRALVGLTAPLLHKSLRNQWNVFDQYCRQECIHCITLSPE